MKRFSTITISVDTKEKLKQLRLTAGETYENIILRLLSPKIGLGIGEARYQLQSKKYPIILDIIMDWDDKDINMYYVDDGCMVDEVPTKEFDTEELTNGWDELKTFVADGKVLGSFCAILDVDERMDLNDYVLVRLA